MEVFGRFSPLRKALTAIHAWPTGGPQATSDTADAHVIEVHAAVWPYGKGHCCSGTTLTFKQQCPLSECLVMDKQSIFMWLASPVPVNRISGQSLGPGNSVSVPSHVGHRFHATLAGVCPSCVGRRVMRFSHGLPVSLDQSIKSGPAPPCPPPRESVVGFPL